jgi:GTP-binding nuclear protein Ran
MQAKRTFKIVVVGDAGVGKTSWVRKLLTGDFREEYVSTLGVEAHCVKLNTNKGQFIFNIWDAAGEEKYRGMRNVYYVGADAVIAMHDFNNPTSFSNLGKWIEEVKDKCVPVQIIVGNKKEFRDSTHMDASGYSNIDISVKKDDSIWLPLLKTARILSRDPFLVLQDSFKTISMREIDDYQPIVKKKYLFFDIIPSSLISIRE